MRKISAIHALDKKMPGRRGKTFKNEELLLLVLYFVRLNPTHGYDIIKSINNSSMGAYSPSPGVIYPNLTLLEEMGYASTQLIEGAKKKYTITRSGKDYLQQQDVTLSEVLEKLKALVVKKHPVRDPEIYYAIENLKISIRTRMHNEELSQEQIGKIVNVLQEATKKINDA